MRGKGWVLPSLGKGFERDVDRPACMHLTPTPVTRPPEVYQAQPSISLPCPQMMEA